MRPQQPGWSVLPFPFVIRARYARSVQSPWLRALLLVTGGCGRTGFEDLPRDAAVASPAPEDALLDTPPACAGSTAQLDSPCLGTFSAKSVYFDVEATRTVTVTGLETLSQSCGTRDVSIYVRPGTHVGVETISSA